MWTAAKKVHTSSELQSTAPWRLDLLQLEGTGGLCGMIGGRGCWLCDCGSNSHTFLSRMLHSKALRGRFYSSQPLQNSSVGSLFNQVLHR